MLFVFFFCLADKLEKIVLFFPVEKGAEITGLFLIEKDNTAEGILHKGHRNNGKGAFRAIDRQPTKIMIDPQLQYLNFVEIFNEFIELYPIFCIFANFMKFNNLFVSYANWIIYCALFWRLR